MSSSETCPLCKQEAVRLEPDGTHPFVDYYNCPTCGEFGICTEASVLSYKQTARGLETSGHCQSAYTRRQAILREKSKQTGLSVEIRAPILTAIPFDAAQPAARGFVFLPDVFAAWPITVAERLDRTLVNMRDMSPTPGYRIPITDRDYPVAYAEDASVLAFLMDQLEVEGFIHRIFAHDAAKGPRDEWKWMIPHGRMEVIFTPKGWNRVAELERGKAGVKPLQAFVAMWFDEGMREVYEVGIKPAVEAAGYMAMRIDRKEYVNKIDDEIIAEIRKSRFLVADITGHRQGVYYEAGFAHGLGLEVVWTCRNDHVDDIHFDCRQYNMIVWKDAPDLKVRLQHRVEAVIGPPDPQP